MKNENEASIKNLRKLDGRVPIKQAIPFGLQHVLAMFVSNLAPIAIVTGVAGVAEGQVAILIQNAMIAAGLATMIQLYPIGRVGARLPIVMGVSFTFVAVLFSIARDFGYPYVVGAVLVGGIFEGTLGLFAKHWRKIIAPIVSSCVVISIGFSLLPVGARSFGGGYTESFGSATNLIIGFVTLLSCLIFQILAKSYYKQLSVLFGLVVGYITSIFFNVVDISSVFQGSWFSLPRLLPFTPKFALGPIVSTIIMFLVSATETIGDTTAMVVTGLDRDITDDEVSGSLACDGYASSLSSLLGCMPVTSFSQNVGLIAMTKVVNRFTIGTGAVFMILAGLFPPLGRFFASLPQSVLGGCTIMLFGSILVSGIQMLNRCEMTQKNVITVSLSLSIGLGFTTIPELFDVFPQMVKDVFGANSVVVVFVLAVLLNWLLPEDMEIKHED